MDSMTQRHNFSSSHPQQGGVYSTTLSGLSVFRQYSIRMRAYTSQGPGMYSDSTTVKTFPAPSSPPTNVQVRPVDTAAVNISWSYPMEPRGDIFGYLIFVNDSGVNINSSTSHSVIMSRNDTSTTVRIELSSLNNMNPQTVNFVDVTPYAYYSFRVRAISRQQQGETNIIHYGEFSPKKTIQLPHVPGEDSVKLEI